MPIPDPTTLRLLNAAADEFIERGYAAARVSEVARRCGMTTGAVYSRWPRKPDVFVAALEDIFQQLLSSRRLKPVGPAGTQPSEVIALLGVNLRASGGPREVMVQAFGSARNNQRVREAVAGFINDEARQLGGIIDRAKENGLVDAEGATVAQALLCQAASIGAPLLLSAGLADRYIPSQQDWNYVLERMIGVVGAVAPVTPVLQVRHVPSVPTSGLAVGGPDPRIGSSETTRQLLEAAAAEFVEHGYDGAVIGDIARRAGVTPGAVYARWSDKSAVMVAALDLIFEQLLPDRRLGEMGIGELAVSDIFVCWGTSVLDPDPARDVLVHVFGSARNNAAVQECLERFLNQRAEQLSRLVQRAEHQRRRDQSVPTTAALMLFQAVGIGAHLLRTGGLDDRYIPPEPDWTALFRKLTSATSP